jgi:hypothetical protein
MSFRTDNNIADTANSERLLELLDGLPLANVNAADSLQPRQPLHRPRQAYRGGANVRVNATSKAEIELSYPAGINDFFYTWLGHQAPLIRTRFSAHENHLISYTLPRVQRSLSSS